MRSVYLPVLLVLLVWLPGCYTTAVEPTGRSAPAYTRAADHYVDFPDAAALAAYLRHGSEAGPLVSAHRGGPVPAYPENTLETFEHSLRYGPVLIECDVRLTRDSALVLLHDATLDRTTTGRGPVFAHDLSALRRLRAVDERGIVTPFQIPTLEEALAWSEGRAVLTLDVKDVPPVLVVDTIRRLKAEDQVVIIVYTLDELLTYYRLAPDLVYSATAETVEEAQALITSGVDLSRLIVFTGVGEVQPEVIALLHAHDIRAILGTFGQIDQRAREAGPEVYQALIDRGVDVVATDLVPVASRAVDAYRRIGSTR